MRSVECDHDAEADVLLLPPFLGLGRPPGSRHAVNRALTVGWYTLGGVTAGAAARLARPAVAGA